MNLDKTFCASPECKNECGRKLPDEYYRSAWENPEDHHGKLISYAYFCGEPDNARVINTFEKPVEKNE